MISLGSSRWTTSNPKITLSFAYEKKRSGADMQYRAQITVSMSSGYFGYPIYLKLSIGGELKETKTLKAASPSQWSSAITYTSPWYTVSNKTTGTTPISFNVYSGQGSSRSATYSYNMEVDPAASKIYAARGTLGTPVNLILTRYNSSFTDTITYQCGTASGTVRSGSTATSVSWGPSNGNTLDLAAQNTSGPTVLVTFTVTTYDGSTPVGTDTATALMEIPASVVPSVTLGVTDAAGYLNTYGAYVQGYSKLSINATPTLAYGSPIKTYAITADGNSYGNNSVITPALRGTGTLTVAAKVVDKRERSSATVTKDITVLPYSKPVVNLSAYRCNSSGTADPEGAYMKIVVTSTISSLNGKNSATCKVVYPGGTLTGGANYTSGVLACDVSSTHNIEVTVTDKLSSVTKAAVIPIAYTLLDYYETGRGIAFGKVATRDGFDCAMPAYFTAGVTVNGKALLDLIYPVGSVYMSVNNVSPQTFFGGTWEQIKDTFLLAAGATYAAGATGGSATHKLSVSELPVHGHNVGESGNTSNVYTTNKSFITSGAYAAKVTTDHGYIDDSSTTYRLVTSNVGSGAEHNNMPPYLAVYVWKRTK